MTQPPTGRPPRGPHPPRGQRGPAPGAFGPPQGGRGYGPPQGGFGPPHGGPGTPQGPRGRPTAGPAAGAAAGPTSGSAAARVPQGGASAAEEGPARQGHRDRRCHAGGAGAGRIRGVEARRPGRGRLRARGCGRRGRRCGTEAPRGRARWCPATTSPPCSGTGLDRPGHRRRRRAGLRLTAARGRPEVVLGDRLPQREALTGRPLRRRRTRPRGSSRRSGRPRAARSSARTLGGRRGVLHHSRPELVRGRCAGAPRRHADLRGDDRGRRGRRRGLRAGAPARREGPLIRPVTAGRGLPIGKAHLPSPHRWMTVAEIVYLLGLRHPRPHVTPLRGAR